MNRIALRFTIGVLAAFMTVIAMWTTLIYWRANVSTEASWLPPAGQLLFPMLKAGAASAARREKGSIEHFVRYLERLMDQPVALKPIDDPEILEAHRRLLKEGKSTIRMEHGGANTYYVPIEGEGRAIAIGPIKPKKPLPPLQFVGFILSTILVVATTGFILALPMMRMMNSMEKTANKIIGGDLSARITCRRFINKDFDGLVDCFNRMAEHNEQLFEKQHHLFQAIAHEMRTPTARMRFGLEMLAMATTEEQKEDRLQALDEDLNELDAFVEELVAYNRLDYGSDMKSTAVPLTSVLEGERAALQHLIGDRSVELMGSGVLTVQADARLFARVIRNLMANAIRYAKSRVVASCEIKGSHVLIHVDDDGNGVPETDRVRIFEPFMRLEESRSKSSGGVGLGLAIVRRIALVHGASVEVSDSPLGGARFTLSWPRAEDTPAKEDEASLQEDEAPDRARTRPA